MTVGLRECSKQNCAVLWYDKPAGNWNEALPVGNGRIGGMVYGAIACEQIQVNEESVWYGDLWTGIIPVQGRSFR